MGEQVGRNVKTFGNETTEEKRRRLGNVAYEATVQEEMNLPDGNTCDDCFAFRFCNGIGCTSSGRTHCDYHPNRFRAKAAKDDGGKP